MQRIGSALAAPPPLTTFGCVRMMARSVGWTATTNEMFSPEQRSK